MRILIISDFGYVNGGAAKVAIESARGLAEAGVKVVFAYAIGPLSERLEHPNITPAHFEGQEVWAVGSKLAAARQGIWNSKAGAFLSELIARQPAGTIIHLHQWTKAFSPAAIDAAAKSGLPVFITCHDYFSFCPAGGYFDFRAGKPCQRQPMSLSCITRNCDRASYAHKLVRVARQWGSDKALDACKNLTFLHVSDFARAFAEPYLPAHARHVTAENMMEAEQGEPAPVAANRHVLFLGRFTQEKGVCELAEAARDADMPVRFVGEGPMAAEIARINPDAEIRPWVAADKVFEEIRQARAIAAPSLWYETGPMSVVEALALGVPGIVSDQMGAAGWVEHGVTGLHVARGDVRALGAALERVSSAEADRWGQNAHASYWAKPFTLARHVATLLPAYG
jgi:glycosyltransferase involved in cell wall biosynthesis